MSTFHCFDTSPFTPRITHLVHPLNNVQMTRGSGDAAYSFAPRTTMRTCPFEDVKVAPFGGCVTCLSVPWTTIAACLLQNVQIATERSSAAYICGALFLHAVTHDSYGGHAALALPILFCVATGTKTKGPISTRLQGTEGVTVERCGVTSVR